MNNKTYKLILFWYLSSLAMAFIDTPKTGETLHKFFGEHYEVLYQGFLLSLSFLFSYISFEKRGMLLAPLHSSLFDLQSHLIKGELPYTQAWAIEKFGILGYLHKTITPTPIKIGYILSLLPSLLYFYLKSRDLKKENTQK
jgi:hypothetical protein